MNESEKNNHPVAENNNEASMSSSLASENKELEVNKLKDQLRECQTQNGEWKDRYLRNAADFENYKKRAEKEKMLWISSAQSTLLNDILTIVDDFDRAFAQPSSEGNLQGFELIYKSLQKLLEKYGVIEIRELTHFDPIKHEAIAQVESPGHASGDIVQVFQKGYLFKGEVLRPAKVSVAK